MSKKYKIVLTIFAVLIIICLALCFFKQQLCKKEYKSCIEAQNRWNIINCSNECPYIQWLFWLS